MGLKLFNTLSRSVESFTPLEPATPTVGMYCCGPTVYDFPHIGNFRTFVFADLVRRYLEFRGYKVRHVMNVTDVEDKIIRRVRESGLRLEEYTKQFEEAFFQDARVLSCLPPHDTPHATQYIEEIVELVRRLVATGFAYQGADGSVYFSIEKYRSAGHNYGQLVRLSLSDLRQGERVRSDEYTKESPVDFALWKARAEEDGAVYWPSPWGEGRPGWHIECSAMSMHLLGPSFDLHLGGEDLIFPHHEDEIAQSEGAGLQALGQPFVKYWLHGAHLLVDGRKMSKSLGNFFTLRELLAKGWQGREIRCLLLGAHYREPLNFTLDGLAGARMALKRIDECTAKLGEIAGGAFGPASRGEGECPHEPYSALEERARQSLTLSSGALARADAAFISAFTSALDDDLNVSAGWAAVFDWVRDTNRKVAEGTVTQERAASALAAWARVDSVLGLGGSAVGEAPQEVLDLVEARREARTRKDFAQSDAIRNQIKSMGWLLEDTPKGPKLKRA